MSSIPWDRVHNRPADVYTPPEDIVERVEPAPEKGAFGTVCFDEECKRTPAVRMSIGGQEVFLCGEHARHLVVAR